MPTGPEWIVETKLDGYRIMARVEDGRARLITRGGYDWTPKMHSLSKAVEDLGIEDAWLDGEIVVMNSKSLPDFNALQNAMGNRREAERIVYFLFDAPYYGRPGPSTGAAVVEACTAAGDAAETGRRASALQWGFSRIADTKTSRIEDLLPWQVASTLASEPSTR